MFSKYFIEHPVLANVVAIVLVLIGAVSVFKLPVAQYPDIVPPTVQVTTRYPGASAQTVIDSVALPIENQVNGVEDALYMQSTSASDGTYTLIVTFAIGLSRTGLASHSGAGARRDGAEEVHCDSPNRHVELAGRSVRQPLHE
jgi:multidrug efflux pump subunit AcrB